MYKNKSKDGLNNICGRKVKEYRKKLPGKVSQAKLADILVLAGLDVNKNAIQRLEAGKRFVTDIELKTLTNILGCTYEDLLE